MSEHDYDEDECGTSIDHDERMIDARDGIETWECQRCGAEWFYDTTEATS